MFHQEGLADVPEMVRTEVISKHHNDPLVCDVVQALAAAIQLQTTEPFQTNPFSINHMPALERVRTGIP